MEAELDTSGLLEVENSSFAIKGDMDTTSFENEKCGICMDVVIDRGAIDSCQHWFCFSCIDNWSTITSLCPLCQKEFQLITCVPVFDTIGSGRADDEFLSGDEEWSIQGSNNTLSFPSYYIDENAVICLDGDGCKIRSGSAKIEDDPNLDTSIACDSCDLWYHAFCVGFDTEATSENSWLCPRCGVNEVAHRFNGASEIDHECSDETALSKPLYVSVADAGETAVVVSSVEKKQCEVPNDNIASALETKEDRIKEHSLSYATFHSTTLETESVYDIQPNSNLPEALLALPFLLDTPGKLKSNEVQVEVEPDCSDGDKTSAGMTSNGSELTISVPNIDLYFGLSLQSSLSVDKNDFHATKSHIEDLMQQMPLEESFLPAEKLGPNAKESAVGFNALKRKVMSSSSGHIDVNEDSEIGIRENSVKVDNGVSAKSARADRKFPKAACNSGVRDSLKRGPQKHPKLPAASENDKVNDVVYKKSAVPDIMTIVRGTLSKPTVRLSDGRDNGAGLRVKKIMRRNVEDESSKLLEELRNQIREAVRNKDTKDLNKYAFDPKLLKAFRAAVGGKKAGSEPSKKLDPSIARAKKSMLQKGKTRESLTKKIYGNVNGRRKRAWDREWEVEFWKHRATNISRPEKMETLKSVLDLLRKSPESSDVDSEPEDDGKSSILSRLYLADTSVFPRKDDIKPLSALTEIDNNETNLEDKISNLTDNNRVGQSLIHNKNTSAISGPSVGDKRKINDSPSLKVGVASRKPMPHDFKMRAQSVKERPGKSDLKIDKRKWALEVLARKTAVTERDSNQRKQEDNSALKGNYPLLAQLPADMKPVLAQSRHNKVPISVRQAQLYRMTEYFLKLADLPVIRRTAITELAVADAVNIEKDVADRSSSKLVYVNLCSQALRQHVHSSKLVGPEESNPSSSSPPHPESAEPSPGDSTDPSIEEALKMAGLVSNSPGDSPYRVTEEEPLSVFDMDSHPDLDIYGDFEYDLGDEDLIGASALNVSMSQTEEVDMKMKVVFSTLNTEKMDDSLNSKDQKSTVTDKEPPDSKEKNMENSVLELATITSCPSLEPLQGELDGELSLAEYEELYGPDKEPVVENFPKIESMEQNKLIIGRGGIVNHTISKGSEHQGESSAEKMLVGGSFPSEVGSSEGNHSPNHSLMSRSVRPKDKKPQSGKQTEISQSVSKKVEAYIKEHIRPLCKSGVITAEQYRWAVTKTTEKVMRYHMKDKNANFLIKEGEKVKKLAEEYVEAAQEKGENPL